MSISSKLDDNYFDDQDYKIDKIKYLLFSQKLLNIERQSIGVCLGLKNRKDRTGNIFYNKISMFCF